MVSIKYRNKHLLRSMSKVRYVDHLPADHDGDNLTLQVHPDTVVWTCCQISKYGGERLYERKSFIHLN